MFRVSSNERNKFAFRVNLFSKLDLLVRDHCMIQQSIVVRSWSENEIWLKNIGTTDRLSDKPIAR